MIMSQIQRDRAHTKPCSSFGSTQLPKLPLPHDLEGNFVMKDEADVLFDLSSLFRQSRLITDLCQFLDSSIAREFLLMSQFR